MWSIGSKGPLKLVSISSADDEPYRIAIRDWIGKQSLMTRSPPETVVAADSDLSSIYA